MSPSEHPKLDIHKPLPGVIRAQQRAKAKADALAAASPVPRQRASSGERKQQEAEIVARREQVTLSCSAPIHSAVMSTAKEDSIGAMVKDNEEPHNASSFETPPNRNIRLVPSSEMLSEEPRLSRGSFSGSFSGTPVEDP